MATKPIKKGVLAKAKPIRTPRKRAAKQATETEYVLHAEACEGCRQDALHAAAIVATGPAVDICSILLPPVPRPPVPRKPWYDRAWDWLSS